MSVTADFATILKDVEGFFTKVESVGEDVIKAVENIKLLTPTFKAELSKFISDAQAIATVIAPIIAAGGTDFVLDETSVAPVLADIKTLVVDFVNFLPTLKSALDAIEAVGVKATKMYA